MVNLESIVSFLLSSFWLAIGGLIGFLFFKLLDNYFKSYGSKTGEIKAEYDLKELKKEVASVVKNSEVIGEIKGQLENLPDLSKIQSAMTTAVKNVEHQFWDKQRLIDIKRDALERIYTSVIEDLNMHHSALYDLNFGKHKEYYITKSLYSVLAHLYFEEIAVATVQYNNVANSYSSKVWEVQQNALKNGSVSQSELEELKIKFQELADAATKILDEVVKVASNLNLKN